MVFRYKRTFDDVKMQMWFSAFRTAGEFVQALLCVILLVVFLSFTGFLPLSITWFHFGMSFVACLLAKAVLTIYLARKFIRNVPEVFQRECAYVCRMESFSVRFENEATGDYEFVSYRDIRKIFTWQKNIFFEAKLEKRSMLYMIPAIAFSDSAECREAKNRLKASVKEFQRPEARETLLGSFAKGLALEYWNHVKFCLKLLAGIAAFLMLFVIAGYITKGR